MANAPKFKPSVRWYPERKVLEGDDGEFYVIDDDGSTVLQACPTREQANEHVRALEVEDEERFRKEQRNA